MISNMSCIKERKKVVQRKAQCGTDLSESWSLQLSSSHTKFFFTSVLLDACARSHCNKRIQRL